MARSVGRTRSVSPVWHLLNRFLVALIIVVLLFLSALAFLPEIQRRNAEKRDIEALRNEIRNQELILDRQKQELELLRTSPEYVENIARDKMDMMKEGEVIFRLDAGVDQRKALDPALLPE